MFRHSTMLVVAGGALVLGAAATAYADPAESESNSIWNEPRLSTGFGLGIAVGGGVTGFTDQTMRDSMSSQVGGLWDVRATIGSHVPIGIDVSYLGEASNVKTLAGTPNGTLVGTTAEAALRYNILPHMAWNPYVFAGVGWQNFQITSMTQATADTGMRSSDNDIEFPMGAGISYRDDTGFLVDLRGTFRAAPNSTLVQDQRTGDFASAHSWEASAAIGYEF